MKKPNPLMQRLNPIKIPQELKDLFPILIKMLIGWLGCGGSLGVVALLIVALSLFGWIIGDYAGNGHGTVTGSGVTLGAKTTAMNKALLTSYTDVANRWQQGLSASQVSQVEQQGVNLPGAVLLGAGKMIGNMTKPNASLYYSYLNPQFTWQTYLTVTTRYWTTRQAIHQKTKHGVQTVYHDVHHTSTTRTPVSMLMTGGTWDGTLINDYKWVTTMTGNTQNGVKTTQIVLVHAARLYTWSRVWNLFRHVPAGSKSHPYFIKDTQLDMDTLAGFIGAVDYTISDPEVQKMVSVLLFSNVTALPTNLGPVAPASTNTIQNVVRWKAYIEAAAKAYHVPAVLLAAVMAQESGGNEVDPTTGATLMSSTGALGLMQVEPSTASGMYLAGAYIGANALADLSNPLDNVEIGAMYFSEQYHNFGNNSSAAESAYNAGAGAEQQALAQGVPVAQNAQTMAYVANIEGSWVPALTPYFGLETATW